MVPSGILFGPTPSDIPISGLVTPVDENGTPGLPQYQFNEYSYVNQPSDPQNVVLSTLGEGEWTLSNPQPNALIIDDGNGGGVKINFNGEVEFLGETVPSEAAQLFWDLVQVDGINNKNQLDILKKENQQLSDRVKELEIKLGYRKQTKIEEPDDRFEGILDE